MSVSILSCNNAINRYNNVIKSHSNSLKDVEQVKQEALTKAISFERGLGKFGFWLTHANLCFGFSITRPPRKSVMNFLSPNVKILDLPKIHSIA